MCAVACWNVTREPLVNGSLSDPSVDVVSQLCVTVDYAWINGDGYYADLNLTIVVNALFVNISGTGQEALWETQALYTGTSDVSGIDCHLWLRYVAVPKMQLVNDIIVYFDRGHVLFVSRCVCLCIASRVYIS